MAHTDPVILLSFDVEEFDAPVERGRAMSMDEQMDAGGRGQRRVLDLLDAARARATMFTTASFAEWHPDLQRRAAAGHEIASHGRVHASFVDADLAEEASHVARYQVLIEAGSAALAAAHGLGATLIKKLLDF